MGGSGIGQRHRNSSKGKLGGLSSGKATPKVAVLLDRHTQPHPCSCKRRRCAWQLCHHQG